MADETEGWVVYMDPEDGAILMSLPSDMPPPWQDVPGGRPKRPLLIGHGKNAEEAERDARRQMLRRAKP